MTMIAPSLLSADFWKLGRDIDLVTQAGAKVLHIDVMDGHFVPNLTMGPFIVKALRKRTTATLDTHLMIENPDDYIDAFAKAGSDWISFHIEAAKHPHRTIQRIKSFGCFAGIALNPGTPVQSLETLIHDVDFVLLMSVNPGFGGQKFILRTLDRLDQVMKLVAETHHKPFIEVDGGVDRGNIRSLVEKGVRVCVAGSSVFGAEDPAEAVKILLKTAGASS